MAFDTNLDFNEEFLGVYNALENSTDHIFLTGPAGSGKSTLLEYFRLHTTKNLSLIHI